MVVLLLVLQRSHAFPGIVSVTRKDGAGYVLHVRPASNSAAHLITLQHLYFVNQQYGTPPATRSHSTVSQA